MSKSKLRKDHKKKIKQRVERYTQAKNRMKNLIDKAMFQMQLDKIKEQGIETKADTNVIEEFLKSQQNENMDNK